MADALFFSFPRTSRVSLAGMVLLVFALVPGAMARNIDPDAAKHAYAACLAQLEQSQGQAQLDEQLKNARISICLAAGGSVTPEDEYLERVRVSQDVQPLGPTPFGEHINTYNGHLSFAQVDIDAPGIGPDLQLVRSFSIPLVGAGASGPSSNTDHMSSNAFVDWDMEVPHIETLSAQRDNPAGSWFFIDDLNRCTNIAAAPTIFRHAFGPQSNLPSRGVVWSPDLWWHGYQMIMPGAGSQDLLRRDTSNNTQVPSGIVVNGQLISFPIVTKSHWVVGCLPGTSNGKPGQGFLAVSPDGTKYWLDHQWSYQSTSMFTGSNGMSRVRVMLKASRIEDRFGNTLTYSYDSNDNLLSIMASDGRHLSLAWQTWNSGTSYRISSATLQQGSAVARTWSYRYDDASHPLLPMLIQASRPDASSWHFNLRPLMISADPGQGALYGFQCSYTEPNNTYGRGRVSGSIRHPSGLLGIFSVQPTLRARSYVPRMCYSMPGDTSGHGYPRDAPASWSLAIRQRQISGAGLPTRTWSYDYSPANGSYADACTGIRMGFKGRKRRCKSTVHTDVSNPAGQVVRSTFSNRFDETESLQKEVQVHSGGLQSSILRTELDHYHAPQNGPWPSHLGATMQIPGNVAQTQEIAPLERRLIIQNGNTYSWQASQFNSYAQVSGTLRDNDFDNQAAVSEQQSYRNDSSQWVLGLPLVHRVGSETSSQNYYRGNDTIYQRKAFGRLLMSYTFNSNGLLQSFTDGNNHKTTLGNYKRAIPRTIRYADNTQKTLLVDDLGQIRSITDEAGHSTSYQYDLMGRLSQIAYPYDSQGWYAKNINYQFVGTAERGIAANHWKRTASMGNELVVTYYNALWQPLLSDTSDTGKRYAHLSTRSDYDWAGRTSFKSYPVSGSAYLSAIGQGQHTFYDALGRVSSKQQDSELGTLSSTIHYLSGNQRSITDPKYHTTTSTYQAFDKPAYDKPIRIRFANGSISTVARDVYGKPQRMTQSGSWTPAGGYARNQSVTHYFAYDSYHRLCRQSSPETGQTGYGYDAADNLVWSAQGLSGSVYSCPSAPPYRQTVYRSYDARNRLTYINYPGGTPDSSLSYYRDGKVHGASRNGASWTSSYYNRGMLKDETLRIDSQSFELRYRYDSEGHQRQITYPSGLQINTNPDGLGRPTQLGTYAANILYTASGKPSQISYGNGGYFSQSLNLRNLASGRHYRIGNVHLSDRSLSWDGNGNPTHISDAVVSSSVNLLHTAQANALQARHYSSSPFLNDINALNTYRAGTDSRSFYYDSLDRLTRLDSRRYGSDRYSYDALGNVRSRQFGGSTRTYSYDSSHNRISSMPGAGAFSYDDRGNVSQAGTFSLTRNRANELIGDALGSSFAYDARGWRVKKHVIAGATHTDYFIYDSNHRLMERIDNGTRSDFVYLGQKAIARITNNKPSYIFGDYQNSPLFETNSAGSVTRAPNFVGYGHPDSTGVSEIPGYSGAAPDAETGLLYLGARYLYAERFLSPDPAPLDPTSPVGLNRYAYANDNPARFTDPDGLYSCDRKGNAEGCDAIAQARGDIKSAASQLPASSSDRRRLVSALNFLGKEGDKNGVTVAFGSAGGNNAVTDTKGKSVTITFNLKQMSKNLSGHGGGSTLRTETAGVLAHEATHGINGRVIGSNPNNLFQEVGTEHNAFEAQAAVARGLGVYSAYTVWDPTWSTHVSLKRAQAVDRQAIRAAIFWCKPGVPGC